MRYFAIFLLLVFILTGCSLLFPNRGKTKDTHYFVLDYKPMASPQRTQQGQWPLRVRIRNFSVTEVFRQNEIVYREESRMLNYYNYELWAVKPEFLVSEMVFQHLKTVHMFRELNKTVDIDTIDYTISGEITAIEELDTAGVWYAHLALSMNMQDTRLRTTVWSRTWDYREPVVIQKPANVVKGISMLLERIMNEAVEDLDQVLLTATPRDSSMNKSIEIKPSEVP